ncbi:MAG: class I SAM-dependent methyltransferase [Sandaracinaceae bacterium]
MHDGAPGDLAFYLDEVRGAASALELGAGDGRIARAIAEAGIATTALERDEGMVALIEDRGRALPSDARGRLRVVQGDMRSFDLGARFDRIVIPFTGIYCLLSEADLDACLGCVARHLAPEGRFVFDAYAADAFHREARPEDYPPDRRELVAEIVRDRERWTVYESSSWDRDAQRMDATYTYLDPSGRERAQIVVGHRYLLADQLEPALERAGMRLVERWGSFDREPFGEPRGSLIAVAALAD